MANIIPYDRASSSASEKNEKAKASEKKKKRRGQITVHIFSWLNSAQCTCLCRKEWNPQLWWKGWGFFLSALQSKPKLENQLTALSSTARPQGCSLIYEWLHMRWKNVPVHLPMNGHMCRVSASSMPTCQNVIFFNLQDLNSEVCNLDKTDVPAPQRSCLEKSGWLSGNSTVSGKL